MITLITGTPGSGKTLYAVWMLQRELKAGRRLVVNGIKDLALDHELIDDDGVRDWHNRLVAGDILVVDEVQRIWGPVPQGAKATPDIEALHIHRHKGVDLVVITQHPNRMNKTVRDLVGLHIHVRRLLGMARAMVYQWDSVRNPGAGFRDAVKSIWSYPKDVYKLYTSAEVHTKPKSVIPKAIYIIPVAVAIGGVLAWRGAHGISGFGSFGKGGKNGSASVVPGSAAPVEKSGSKSWRAAGRYVVDGRAWVVVADSEGRFRSVSADKFKGDGAQLEGDVDGDHVTPWSGSLASSAPVATVGGGK